MRISPSPATGAPAPAAKSPSPGESGRPVEATPPPTPPPSERSDFREATRPALVLRAPEPDSPLAGVGGFLDRQVARARATGDELLRAGQSRVEDVVRRVGEVVERGREVGMRLARTDEAGLDAAGRHVGEVVERATDVGVRLAREGEAGVAETGRRVGEIVERATDVGVRLAREGEAGVAETGRRVGEVVERATDVGVRLAREGEAGVAEVGRRAGEGVERVTEVGARLARAGEAGIEEAGRRAGGPFERAADVGVRLAREGEAGVAETGRRVGEVVERATDVGVRLAREGEAGVAETGRRVGEVVERTTDVGLRLARAGEAGVAEAGRRVGEVVERATDVGVRLAREGEAGVAETGRRVGEVVERATDVGVRLAREGEAGVAEAYRLAEGSRAVRRPVAHRESLTSTDRAILDHVPLETLEPGQRMRFETTANAEVAAVLGVEVGARVNVFVERRADDPNQFRLGFGGGGNGAGQLTGDTAGAEASTHAGLEASAGVELSIDLSRPGEATQTAAFLAHMGTAGAVGVLAAAGPQGGALAGGIIAGVAGVEALPGVDVPGEPVDFIRDHVSAVEVAGGGRVTERLGGSLGPSIVGQLEQYGRLGGRVEFNADGTFTTRGRIEGGAEGATLFGGGAGGARASARGVGGQGGVSFEQVTVYRPGVPPEPIRQGYVGTIQLQGDVATGGVRAEVRVPLDGLPSAVEGRIAMALAQGDTARASALLDEAMRGGRATGTLSLTGLRTFGGEVALRPSAGGVGGGVGAGAQLTSESPLGEVRTTITGTGIRLEEPALGYPAGAELTWEQLGRAGMETSGPVRPSPRIIHP